MTIVNARPVGTRPTKPTTRVRKEAKESLFYIFPRLTMYFLDWNFEDKEDFVVCTAYLNDILTYFLPIKDKSKKAE
jgi:hypothetical protein